MIGWTEIAITYIIILITYAIGWKNGYNFRDKKCSSSEKYTYEEKFDRQEPFYNQPDYIWSEDKHDPFYHEDGVGGC